MFAARTALTTIAGRAAHTGQAATHPQSHITQSQQQQILTTADPGHDQLSAAPSASLSLSPAASLYAPDGSAASPHGEAACSAAPVLPLEGELAAFSAVVSPYRISGSGTGATGSLGGVVGPGGDGQGQAAVAGAGSTSGEGSAVAHHSDGAHAIPAGAATSEQRPPQHLLTCAAAAAATTTAPQQSSERSRQGVAAAPSSATHVSEASAAEPAVPAAPAAGTSGTYSRNTSTSAPTAASTSTASACSAASPTSPSTSARPPVQQPHRPPYQPHALPNHSGAAAATGPAASPGAVGGPAAEAEAAAQGTATGADGTGSRAASAGSYAAVTGPVGATSSFSGEQGASVGVGVDGGGGEGDSALPVAGATASAAAAGETVTAAASTPPILPAAHPHHSCQQHHQHHPQHEHQHHQHAGLHSRLHAPVPPVLAHLSAQSLSAQHPHQHHHQDQCHHQDQQHNPHQQHQQHPHQQHQQALPLPPLSPAPAPQPSTYSPRRLANGVRSDGPSGAAMAVQGIQPWQPSEDEEVIAPLLGAPGGAVGVGCVGGRASALDSFRRSYRVVRGATGAATAPPESPFAGGAAAAGRSLAAAAPATAPPSVPTSLLQTQPQQPQQPQSQSQSQQPQSQSQQQLGRVSSSGTSTGSLLGNRANSNSQLLLQQQLHSIDAIHQVFGSSRLASDGDPRAPNQKLIAAVAGTGLAPWEIHRPQKFVRDLVLRGCFSGRVLDAGCGIGDNALFIAQACLQAHVTAVDVVPRCLDFAHTKAGLRNLPASRLELALADLRQLDSLPETLPATTTAITGAAGTATGTASDTASAPPLYDVVLDSCTFHSFTDGDQEAYLSCLRRLLRPGGLMFIGCMSEAETRPGGPRRVSEAELRSVAHPGTGWQVEDVEETYVELHPTFWGGRAPAHLFTVRRL